MVTNKSRMIRKAASASRMADFWYTIAYRALQLHRFAMRYWEQYSGARNEMLDEVQTTFEPAPNSAIVTE